ncbi:MAG: PqqD family protein [Elusimicrobia bacterium]|nr:PqqD family protein [Elusimicrobiota bacterium]
MSISHDAVGRYAKHVAWRKIDCEIVILDLEARQYFSLNGTASQVWELIGKGLSEEVIAEELADAYHQDVSAVRRDVTALIKRLKAENLVSSESDPFPPEPKKKSISRQMK